VKLSLIRGRLEDVTKGSKNDVTSFNGKVAQRTRTPGNHRKGLETLKSWWKSSIDKPGNAPTSGGRMKRKGFPQGANQTPEVFHPTTSSSKMDKTKIGYSGTKAKEEEACVRHTKNTDL